MKNENNVENPPSINNSQNKDVRKSASKSERGSSLLHNQTNGNDQVPIKLKEFFINDNEKNKIYKYRSNYISTTKYNILTFLPKCLFIQFTRLANVYFLVCAIIQSIDIISPLSSATAIIPLLFVLMVSMLRELLEDLSRYKYDKINNDEEVIVYRNNYFQNSKSSSIRMGEILIIKDNKTIPCDMVLLDSKLSEGICYVETGSLDGEKALKQKNSIQITKKFFSSKVTKNQIEKLNNFDISGDCQCDQPNPDLNKLDGKVNLILNNQHLDCPICENNMLLKGAIIKHTGWCVGFCLYTGLNNKILLNSKRPRVKVSKIEKKMSKFLIIVFGFQMILCVGCSINHSQLYNKHKAFYDNYLIKYLKHQMESFTTFFTYLLLLNTLIPISLIITLEIVKIAQGFFIGWDISLYSHTRKKFCKAASVSLNEELGNVNYIFTDKTGTLTCNKMQFKYCIIGGICYEYKENFKNNVDNGNNKDKYFSQNNIVDDVSKAYLRSLNNDNKGISLENLNKKQKMQSSKNSKPKIIQIGDDYFLNLILKSQKDQNSSNKINKLNNELNIINEFWKALACSHECLCSETENGLEYSGISPDDIELVRSAANQGYTFLKSSQNNIRRISIGKNEHYLEILNIINFTSERKRMSIILKENNIIKLYIKGADSEIKKRLNKNLNTSNQEIISYYVDKFSEKGYRTLMIGEKTITQKDYDIWSNKLRKAEMNLEQKHKMTEKCYNDIEQNINLLGATVVEDKLQENVPETIRDLRLAGIKIWVLTGDKMDTAENISLSCNLISSGHKIFRIFAISNSTSNNQLDKSYIDSELELSKFLSEFQDFAYQEEENFLNHSSNSKDNINNSQYFNMTPFSIIIEAPILAGIFRNEETLEQFLQIALYASTVVCCRVSPLQKSEVVRIVKKYKKNAVTLAIGDGGNDVSMIMEAHIGIGLYGEEGLRAVQSSDFSIGEFQILRRLVLFHGRINSNRISHMILYFFYKNFLFTITLFYYSFKCLSSGQSIIDDWYITLYNLVFTSLPLGVVACTDFDVKEGDNKIIVEMQPFLYKESRDFPIFNLKNFIFNLFKGLFFSFINYYLCYFGIFHSAISKKGYPGNLWYESLVVYTNIIISVSITLLIIVRFISFLLPLIMGITTFGLYLAFCIFVHYNSMFNSFASVLDSFESVKLYLNIILLNGIVFIIEYSLNTYKFCFSTSMCTQLMLMNHFNNFDENSLPEIISNARKNIELMTKYNNYSMLDNKEISISHSFIFNTDENHNLLKKSKTTRFKSKLHIIDRSVVKAKERKHESYNSDFYSTKNLPYKNNYLKSYVKNSSLDYTNKDENNTNIIKNK